MLLSNKGWVISKRHFFRKGNKNLSFCFSLVYIFNWFLWVGIGGQLSSGGFQPRKDASYCCRHLILSGCCHFFKKGIDQGLPRYWKSAPVLAFSTLKTIYLCSWKLLKWGLKLQEHFSYMNHVANVKETLFRFFTIDLKSELILPLSTTEEKHRAVIWKNINTFTRWHRRAVGFCEHWE